MRDFAERPVRMYDVTPSQLKEELMKKYGLSATEASEQAAIEFRRNLNYQKNLIEARDNITIRSVERGKIGGKLFQFTKKYPLVKNVKNSAVGIMTGQGLSNFYGK